MAGHVAQRGQVEQLHAVVVGDGDEGRRGVVVLVVEDLLEVRHDAHHQLVVLGDHEAAVDDLQARREDEAQRVVVGDHHVAPHAPKGVEVQREQRRVGAHVDRAADGHDVAQHDRRQLVVLLDLNGWQLHVLVAVAAARVLEARAAPEVGRPVAQVGVLRVEALARARAVLGVVVARLRAGEPAQAAHDGGRVGGEQRLGAGVDEVRVVLDAETAEQEEHLAQIERSQARVVAHDDVVGHHEHIGERRQRGERAVGLEEDVAVHGAQRGEVHGLERVGAHDLEVAVDEEELAHVHDGAEERVLGNAQAAGGLEPVGRLAEGVGVHHGSAAVVDGLGGDVAQRLAPRGEEVVSGVGVGREGVGEGGDRRRDGLDDVGAHRHAEAAALAARQPPVVRAVRAVVAKHCPQRAQVEVLERAGAVVAALDLDLALDGPQT